MSIAIDEAAVMWSAGAADRVDRPLLVLLHGYGSHEGDLFGLSPYLPLAPAIASVRAPIPLAPGHAWFDLREGPHGIVSTVDEVAEATDALLAWIDALSPRPSSIGLLGFSQGGAMALELLRARPGEFAFAVVLAGFVAGMPGTGDAALAQAAPPVFWGRGTADAVIPADLIDRTQAWLPGHSTLTERIYEGVPHAVSEAELKDVVAFLRERYRP
ncbi:alpha/beta fold hydrolase [Rathayibacter sp. YIM 133350]|uniref:alpha/beta hydrolase n=1 Tax=Rathayibacter sp. YIM 133350 TaxID=3131992 RepID=UPI00307DC6D7